jgi:pimeloyl-ACP methyl ester carboxylesterase
VSDAFDSAVPTSARKTPTYAATPTAPGSLVVVLLHGIRTEGYWEASLAKMFRASIPGCFVYPVKYSYYDAFRLLAPAIFAKSRMERVLDQIELVRAQHPDSRIVVIAHSFGTYLITKLLTEKPLLKLQGLILCGSIVPRDFKWARVLTTRISSGQIEFVINDCGARDIWPLLAQSITWGYGASGTFGFDGGTVDRLHYMAHSDFLTEEFARKFWIPVLTAPDSRTLQQTAPVSDWDTKSPPPPKTFPYLDWIQVKWLVVVALLGIAAHAAYSRFTDPDSFVLSGRVVDEQGRSVAGALVSKGDGSPESQFSQPDGSYRLVVRNVPRDSSFSLRLTHPEYKTGTPIHTAGVAGTVVDTLHPPQ